MRHIFKLLLIAAGIWMVLAFIGRPMPSDGKQVSPFLFPGDGGWTDSP